MVRECGGTRSPRVLAVARRDLAADAMPVAGLDDNWVRDMVLIGYLLLSDPIPSQCPAGGRRSARVRRDRKGDHGRSLGHGLCSCSQTGPAGVREYPTGPQLEALDPAELQEAVADTTVFSRVTSSQKVALVM